MTLQVKVVSPWFGSLETTEAFFSSRIASEDADALLCDWAPSDELLTFKGRKAWYCCEPAAHFRSLGSGDWPSLRSRLADGEFLWHGHQNPLYRVPHITHVENLQMNRSGGRLDRAVAIVSNYGGPPFRRGRGTRLRNKFVSSQLVDLFGRESWSAYRERWFSRARAPRSYKGNIAGDWSAAGKRQVLSQYRVAICMENANEPGYFTEKFVDAVCAGCVPVYHADETSAAGPLKGAFWIDPADYGNDSDATIAAALAADMQSVQDLNTIWLESNNALRMSGLEEVYRTIGSILSRSL